jgi:hypothetical protein
MNNNNEQTEVAEVIEQLCLEVEWGEAEYMVNGKTPWNKGDKYKSFIKGEATQTFPDTKKPTPPPSWEDIEKCKDISEEDMMKDYEKLQNDDMSENRRSFSGNKVIYSVAMKHMIKTKYKGKATLEEQYKADPQKMWEQVCKMDRRKARAPDATDVFELNRAITFFKPSIAKHIYQRYNATSVFDPCAGWGGRALGAMVLGIPYQGCDTNKDLDEVYEELWYVRGEDEEPPDMGIEVMDCLDFLTPEYIAKSPWWPDGCSPSKPMPFKYDCVLTSPPYYDLEIYPHQEDLPSEEEWYKKWLMPVISRCYKFMEKGGHCCINMSPKMYERIVEYGFPPCHEKVNFLQQKNTAQWGEGVGKQDLIYVWRK